MIIVYTLALTPLITPPSRRPTQIDAYELKTALREGPMSGALEITEAEVDAIVAAMISWADINADGEIDFDEYKRIIKAGCEPGGRKEPRAERAAAAASS